MSAHGFAIVGLTLNTVGALLLLPGIPSVVTWTADGGSRPLTPEEMTQVAPATRRSYERRRFRFRVGVGLLVLGFVLQGVDLLS